MTKRLATMAISAFALVVLTAGAALAQQDYPPDVLGEGGANVEGTGGTAGAGAGGTAFSGSDVSLYVMAAVALVVVGVSALMISRRRSMSPA
jgi:hypothetical protein